MGSVFCRRGLACLVVFLAASSFGRAAEESSWTVIFRADDPLLFNHNAGKPTDANGFAISTAALDKVRFLRMKRMDSGEYVIVKMEAAMISKTGLIEGDLWWGGGVVVRGSEGHRNRLLGISRRTWPTTQRSDHLIRRASGRMDRGYRGWGFSKISQPNTPDGTWSWDGKPIDKTIFEIAVTSQALNGEEQAHLLKPEGPSVQELNTEEKDEPSPAETAAEATPDPSNRTSATTRIARQQTSIHALYVRETETGAMLGQTSELILTAMPGKMSDRTPVTFTTAAGKEMHMVLDDAVRWVRLKYPRWDASKVELSFEDKYTPKDGGSIGAAIGTLLLSMIEGFEVDPKFAITGDVTADGKIRAIGGVAAKMRGATAGGCTVMAVPTDNYQQVCDALVWEGPKILSNIQVIGVGNLPAAEAVARVDRDEKLKQAIDLFADVQAKLAKSPDSIHYKENIDKLSSIVDLAPDHYSAKLLLAVAQNKQPRKLSATASMYYTFISIGNMGPTLIDRAKNPAKGQVTPQVVKDGLRQLDKVRRVSAPETIPFVNAWSDMIKAWNDLETGVGSPQMLQAKVKQFEDVMAKLKTNRDLMEKMLHEGI